MSRFKRSKGGGDIFRLIRFRTSRKMDDQLIDNWDEQDDPGPGDAAQSTNLSSQFSKLNVNAKPFIPNVNAPEFVPSFASKTTETSNGAFKVAFIVSIIMLMLNFQFLYSH